MSVLRQKRDRDAAGVQRAFDDLWAFGNKNSILWVAAVSQLLLGKAGIDVQLRVKKISDR